MWAPAAPTSQAQRKVCVAVASGLQSRSICPTDLVAAFLASGLRSQLEQEVTQMAFDMTTQLAPMVWAMVALMAVSGVSLLMSHR